ncbi:SIMPL domain-containing protein [Leifsonia sp. F6_8S_P_1B]|uniref:SIMPL domain-containing protein n=1 Tax=Leifsonia williamsii TaxID=3035919 RepID=A0ABT8KCH7_9MICO|nr:SIMPL domain-containing protein [Leifsonia williamsii]MDN4614877.1 SIMPL domain-containing protein [Leifsonia williamsii]
MADTIITVQGEYELRHPAERGTVRLLVAYDGEDREETLALATQRHQQLARELRDLQEGTSGPVAQWSSDSLRVWGERPWNQEGRRLPVVFHAQVGVEAVFGELGALSDWVGVVSLLDGVQVEGVTWGLTEARRQSLTQEARRRAVENAVAKATVYATSLGLSSVRPVALSDPGMLGDGAAPPQPPQPMFARAAADLGGATLALKPEDLTIAVQVHARFAAS